MSVIKHELITRHTSAILVITLELSRVTMIFVGDCNGMLMTNFLEMLFK